MEGLAVQLELVMSDSILYVLLLQSLHTTIHPAINIASPT
jgi:hypothetical protein